MNTKLKFCEYFKHAWFPEITLFCVCVRVCDYPMAFDSYAFTVKFCCFCSCYPSAKNFFSECFDAITCTHVH